MKLSIIRFIVFIFAIILFTSCSQLNYLNALTQHLGINFQKKQISSSNSIQIKNMTDFESGSAEPFKGGELVRDKNLNGEFALVADNYISITQAQNWSGYDQFRFDVYNPLGTSTLIRIEIRDTQTKDYWSRVNYETVVPSGKSTLTIPTDLYVGEKSRKGRKLLLDQITHIFIDPNGKKLSFNNFRLEKIDTAKYIFDSLYAFDFGDEDSPVMEGFRQVTKDMNYNSQRGFGWDGADIWKSFNVLQPDPLYEDFICIRKGNFRVDLPNGKYHVVLNIDAPSGYWGEVQTYTQRKVLANGITVVNENMQSKTFLEKYFRNANKEDFPGVDTFNEYVQTSYHLKEFDVTVTDGKLLLGFEGQGFAISLSALVIYPIDKSTQGHAFWDWVTERRRIHFNDDFKQIIPPKLGLSALANDYRIFSRSFMKLVQANDGPEKDEELTDEHGLNLIVAQGEEQPLVFSIQPPLNEEMGEVNLEFSDFNLTPINTVANSIKVSTKDSKAKSKINSKSKDSNPLRITSGWLDYRIQRSTMDGKVYTVAPRFWHPIPAPMLKNITRNFWIRVKPSVGMDAGIYKGHLSIKPKIGKVKIIPIEIKVLPFSLDPITDLAVGPFGSSIDVPEIYLDHSLESGRLQWNLLNKSLDVLKESGCTTFSGLPHLKFTAKGGKILLNTELADREMALVRQKGFKQMISSYGVDLGYQMKGNATGPDNDFAKNAGFANTEDFLRELYSAIDKHAISQNWLPIAWNIADEPDSESLNGSALNAEAHRKAALGLNRTTFMGETSLKGSEPSFSQFKLIKFLPIVSLNEHDEGSISVLKNTGNLFSFYNENNRWTYGRYMKMLVYKYDLAQRLSWHFNNNMGDPYYALDSREDDYSWFNTNVHQQLVPTTLFLTQILPGLNDYRLLSTLQRLLKENPKHPGAENGLAVFNSMMDLKPWVNIKEPKNADDYEADRKKIIFAIESLLTK